MSLPFARREKAPGALRDVLKKWGRRAMALALAVTFAFPIPALADGSGAACAETTMTGQSSSPDGRPVGRSDAAATFISLPASIPGRPSAITVTEPSVEPEMDAVSIAAKVQAVLESVQDLQQRIQMEIIHPEHGHVTRAAGQLRAKMPHLFRIDFTQPAMLSGVAVAVDLTENMAWQYQPVTEQIVVQPWSDLARERGVEFDVENWLGVPDPTRFHLRRLRDYSMDGTVYYVLEGRPRQAAAGARYEFLVDPTCWWVAGIRLYDSNDRLTFSAFVDEVVFDQGLDPDQLRSFPAGADILYR